MQYFGFDRPSFGIKTLGFGESSPKLQADFTTGTYKADGEAKTFADIFTFSRAGKAWLDKDTGLQEYAADVPRLDNGLLIEKEVTNYLAEIKPHSYSNSFYSTTLTDSGNFKVEIIADYVNSELYKPTAAPEYPAGSSSSLHGNFSLRQIYVHETNANYLLGRNYSYKSTSIKEVLRYTEKTNSAHSLQNRSGVGRPEGGGRISGNIGDYAIISNQLFTITDYELLYTTHIPTTTTPVTRPADYLLNKISGTTVTGDWDSTLTLSIVAGQLVHSGYGRIRSLEIN